MHAPFARVWKAIEAWALPAACLGCGLHAPIQPGLCGLCRDELRPASPDALPELAAKAVTLYAAFDYEPFAGALLTRYKFGEDLAAGRALSQLASEVWREAPRPDALVPIPLHRERLRQRGHDQALGLARDAARALQLPLAHRVLHRTRHTTPQTQLDASGRRRNLLDAFCADQPCPAHVVLIDDVVTTGSTLSAAAEALRQAGAVRIDAWVVARASARAPNAMTPAMR